MACYLSCGSALYCCPNDTETSLTTNVCPDGSHFNIECNGEDMYSTEQDTIRVEDGVLILPGKDEEHIVNNSR